MNGHLVTVEVGVEGRTYQRVQLDGLAFDQHRFERLDAQAVQRRGAVQQYRMFADHVFEDVPDFRHFLFDQLLGSLDGAGQAEDFQLVEDERLEQFQRHLFRQTALMQTQGRAHGNHRTTRVVDALAQQVLTETAALALDHVGQRLQRALVGAGHGLAATTVVQQRVDRFLQHALFVAHDDFRRAQLQQPLEAVVAVDHAAVQVVQVGGRETTAVQRHQRTQFRRQHRQHFQDHPVRLDAGTLERLEHLQALGDLLDLGFRAGGFQVGAQRFDLGIDVEALQQRADAFGAHQRFEFVTVLLDLVEVVFFGQQLLLLQRRHARFGHDEAFEVQHAFDVAQRHVEDHAQTRRQRLQEPDVRNRAGQLDVAHAFAAHLAQRDFNAAFFADHAAMLEALVLAAQALVVLDRAEDAGAEQAIALRLEGTVVDRFRLFNFAERPGTDFVRRRDADLDRVEFFFLRNLLEEVEQSFHVFSGEK